LRSFTIIILFELSERQTRQKKTKGVQIGGNSRLDQKLLDQQQQQQQQQKKKTLHKNSKMSITYLPDLTFIGTFP
jgi:hypothetical protein